MDDCRQNLVKVPNILTDSNESETFDSWTLVSDAVKPKQSSPDVIVASDANENEPSGIQHLENEDDSNKNHDTDDLSDGISIISECESAGRLSPTTTITSTTSILRTALPSNLNDATTINNENHNRSNNNNELLTPPTTPKKYLSPHHVTSESLTQQDRIAHYVELISSSSLLHDLDRVHNDDNEEQQLTVPSTSNTASSSSSLSSCPITNLLSFIRFPMSKIFIISSIILLISFFGNIKLLNNTNWSSLSTNIPQLFDRIENLELQNNLLRAEIDILSKNLNSINYNNRREKYQKDDKQKFNSNPNDEDKIKWKNDDKNYDNKVDNNDNKNNRKKEQIIIQKDENFIKKSNINEKTDIPLPPLSSATPKNDDKNSLNLENQNQSNNNGPVINDDNNSNERSKQNQNENESNLKSDGGKNFKKKYDNSKDNYENKKYEKIKYDKKKKYEKKKFGYDDDDSKELTNSKEYYDKKKKYEKNEKHFKKYHDFDDDDDHDDGNDSKERKNYKYDKKHNSKEKYDSREREYYGKRKNGVKENVSSVEGGRGGKYENYDDRYKDDWHEKMMQHREESRKAKYDNNNNNNDNSNDNNNWYLERGKGREKTRIFEKNN